MHILSLLKTLHITQYEPEPEQHDGLSHDNTFETSTADDTITPTSYKLTNDKINDPFVNLKVFPFLLDYK